MRYTYSWSISQAPVSFAVVTPLIQQGRWVGPLRGAHKAPSLQHAGFALPTFIMRFNTPGMDLVNCKPNSGIL